MTADEEVVGDEDDGMFFFAVDAVSQCAQRDALTAARIASQNDGAVLFGTIGNANFSLNNTDLAYLEISTDSITTYTVTFHAGNGSTEEITKTLRYTEAQKKQTQAERDNVKAWVKECRATFCTGESELNDPSNPTQWAKYLEGLEKNGLSTWQQQVQSIYDSQK